MKRAWFAGLLAAAAATAAGAADPVPSAPSTGKPFVVLVGVGEFADKAISARPTAEADARDLYDLFTDGKYFDVPKDRVLLLTATPDAKRGSEPATRANVLKALHEAFEKTGKDDTVIIGWFGRAAFAGDNTALFTKDTVLKDRGKTAVVGPDLEKDFRVAEDRKVVVLLDVSFKGSDFGKEIAVVPQRPLRDLTLSFFNEDEDGGKLPSKNKAMFLATVPQSSVSLNKGDKGLFAATLVDALKGAADAEGYHEGYAADGVVTVDELVKYLEKEVKNQAREIGTTKEEKEAVPFILGDELSHFPLTKNPKLTAQVETRLKKLADLEKAKTIDAAVAAEGKKLLSQMPKLKAMQDLRKKYEALADGTLPAADLVAERGKVKDAMLISADDADRYARNVMKAVELARSKYVKDLTAGEWGAMAINGLYYKLDEPVPADIAKELKDAKGLTRSRLQELLKDVRERLGKREDLDGVKDLDTTLSWMFVENRDPYTSYFDEETIRRMESAFKGELRGVGIQIRQDLVRDGLLVVSPIKDGPAYKAGIKAGDLIVEIRRESNPEGKPLKDDEPKVISTKGMKTEDAIKIILGTVGVPITLVVEREEDGKKVQKSFDLRRGLVSIESVLGVKRDEKDDWDFLIDPVNKIGYVCLTQFTPTTARDLDAAIKKLIAGGGLKGLVLDLRFNPGGLLTQAVLVSDLFLDDGLIVSVRYRYKEEEKWYDRGAGAYLNFPMAVLVNGNSASASEIVSACLQDYNRAVVIGERSFGKGSVQNIEDFFPTKGQIKMTTARYFPPLGRNIDKRSTTMKPEDEWGVKPDKGFEVELTSDEKTDLAEHFRDREIIGKKPTPEKEKPPFKDKQLEKALDYLKGQVKAAAAKDPKKAG